jgi:hypothetical protein
MVIATLIAIISLLVLRLFLRFRAQAIESRYRHNKLRARVIRVVSCNERDRLYDNIESNLLGSFRALSVVVDDRRSISKYIQKIVNYRVMVVNYNHTLWSKFKHELSRRKFNIISILLKFITNKKGDKDHVRSN